VTAAAGPNGGRGRVRRDFGCARSKPRPRSFARALGAVVTAALVAACGAAAETEAGGALVPIGAGLRGPATLRASVYATGLRHVSAFAFDARGRLWAVTSGATDHASDALYLVPSAGVQPIEIAGALDGPLGLAWYRGSLYVASIGRVEAFSGLRGRRFTRRRTILDGPVRGASNNAIVVMANGLLALSVSTTCDHCRPASPWAATIVTFRPDGTDLRVFASGVRAAFGLVSIPGTNELLATMNQRDDLGARTPGDWLAFVRHGQNWGFPGCYGQGGAVCRAVPAPTAVLDEHAAAGGVAIVDGMPGATPAAAVVAEWQKGKVLRVPLTARGSADAGAGATTLVVGIQSPLPVAAMEAGFLVGDWSTGVVYAVTAR
jgi:glucose/arabinose dehydrogenase